MTIHQSLPFEVGHLAEAKSFQAGYRGAWFRCKIHDTRRRHGQIEYAMEYYDYPGEKIKWTRIYQKPMRSTGLKEVKRELMVRPQFPPVYCKSELQNVNTVSEVFVGVDGIWRVGDLVDWLYEGCFWSGTITEVVGDDKVKIKLPEPPIGEGLFYEASCKDLRPSLDWSPEIGWTVPKPLESQKGRSCPRLIQLMKQGPLPRSFVGVAEDDMQDIRTTPKSLLEFDESTSSHTSMGSVPFLSKSMHSKDLAVGNQDVSVKDTLLKHGAHVDLDMGGFNVGRPSYSDGVSSTCSREVPDEAEGANSAQGQHNGGSAKRTRVNETISLNSTDCNSMESSIMDLEELVNKIKWLREILKSGIPSSSEAATWKFLQQSTASTPK